MTHDYPANVALLRHLTTLFQDLSDLVDREIRLAKSEISAKISNAIKAGVLFAVAGVVAFLAVLMLLGAAVFAIAAAGLALYWSFLIVAAVLVVIALVAFAIAKGAISKGMVPDRSIRQVRKTVEDAKEQLQ